MKHLIVLFMLILNLFYGFPSKAHGSDLNSHLFWKQKLASFKYFLYPTSFGICWKKLDTNTVKTTVALFFQATAVAGKFFAYHICMGM